MAKRWTKLEQPQRQEREEEWAQREEFERDRPGLDFSDDVAMPGLGSSHFGGFGWRRRKSELRSGDHGGSVRFKYPLGRPERPAPGQAVMETVQALRATLPWEPPIFLGGRPLDWLPDFWGQVFERALFYFVAGEWIKPSAKLELQRMPSLPRFQKSPLLTKSYLDSTPDRLIQHTWGVIHALRFLDAGGLIQVCPPETTTRQLNRRKVGRPALNGVAMTAAERKRRSRLKTLPPQERIEPGAAAPLSLRPAVPGNYQPLWMEIAQMVTEVELGLASKWHERLGALLEKLASAPPDYLLSWEEFRLLGAAAVLQERSPDVLQ